MATVHPKDSDKPDGKRFRAERARRRREAQLKKLDRNMRDEKSAQRERAQMVLGEES